MDSATTRTLTRKEKFPSGDVYALDGKGSYRVETDGDTLKYHMPTKYGSARHTAQQVFGSKPRYWYGVVTYANPSLELIRFRQVSKKEYDKRTGGVTVSGQPA